MPSKFPVSGSRWVVYDYLRSLGFEMSGYSDKVWKRKGATVHIFGSGSKARVMADGKIAECSLDELQDMLHFKTIEEKLST